MNPSAAGVSEIKSASLAREGPNRDVAAIPVTPIHNDAMHLAINALASNDEILLRHNWPIPLELASMSRHCFAYGSLMCDDIMATVCGLPIGILKARRARLDAFARHPVIDEVYPGIVPATAKTVEGIVYLHLPHSAWYRLDIFEGEMYERQSVTLHLEDETALLAESYVLRPRFAHRLGPGDWDFATFLREGKAHFIDRYLGFDRI